MIVTTLSYKTDLDRGLVMQPLQSAFMTGDNEAHRIVVTCTRRNEPVDMSGAGVTAYFIRSDGVTLPIIGSIEDHAAVVQLPAACYVRPGRFSLVVKAAMGETISSILWAEGAVSRSKTDDIRDPLENVPSLDELLAQIDRLEKAIGKAETVANMTVEAKTLPAGSEATAQYNEGKLTLGIPSGESGSGTGGASVDDTLTVSGAAADAKVVGDKIGKLSQYVTPEMFGAKGDGTADDTAAVESAVASGGLVIFPGTGYKIGGRAIKIPSNTYLLGFGAKIIPYNWRGVFTNENSGADEIVTTNGKVIGANENIRIAGLIFDGTVMKDLGRETPYGIVLSGVKDCVIENCKFISNKDGIYIGTYQNPRDTEVTIRNCEFTDFWRQGVTIIHGTAHIDHCKFTRNEETGINGVDAEPNYVNEIPKVTVRNCEFSNCSIYANRKDTAENYGHEDLELIVEDCQITSGVAVSCIDASFMKHVHIKNCVLNDIAARTDTEYAAAIVLFRASHAAVENCRIASTSETAISTSASRAYINDCHIVAERNGLLSIGERCDVTNTYIKAKGEYALRIRDYVTEAVVTGCEIDGLASIGYDTANDVYPQNVRFTFNTIKNDVGSTNEYGLEIYADNSTFVYNRVSGFAKGIDATTYPGTGNIVENNISDVVEEQTNG